MASENEHLSRDEIRLVQETFDRLWPTASRQNADLARTGRGGDPRIWAQAHRE